jgi:nucleoside 2-deoxyribosyltransferase
MGRAVTCVGEGSRRKATVLRVVSTSRVSLVDSAADIIGGVKVYFAGPLFSGAERSWNAQVAESLRAAGHEVFLPQEMEASTDAAEIFATDVGGIDWADAVVAIMDGPDPDSGTAWEVGYAYRKKPIVLVRTDFRTLAGRSGGYNPMLTEAASIRLDLPSSTATEVADAIVSALGSLEPN